ncbi:MAG TPA: cyclodeaminase/cyclohydrolase family protein [Humisphaera sp.]|jgi:formiminotetrahydrofolate cyclodeaminase|nr:cyclodeaminase/cyclohydrolase family protein [Humisphaera sp.]
MFDQKNTIADFLNATAAKRPTPGGGSVAALVGALAAAIGEMVLNYSLKKKGLEIYTEDLEIAVHELHCGRDMMVMLMVEDQTAYSTLTAIKKQPEGPQRDADYATALNASIITPQSMLATAVALLGVCERVADLVNWYLLSDLAVCAELAMATARCAAYNVRVNLPELKDSIERQRIESELTQILARGVEAIQRVIPHIWSRIANAP